MMALKHALRASQGDLLNFLLMSASVAYHAYGSIYYRMLSLIDYGQCIRHIKINLKKGCRKSTTLMGSPAYSQNTRHSDTASGRQPILHTHLFTTPMLGQRRKRWPNIISTLGQCLVFAVATVHAVDRITCDNHCARSVRPYPIHFSAKANPALVLVTVVICSFTASVAATIKACR